MVGRIDEDRVRGVERQEVDWGSCRAGGATERSSGIAGAATGDGNPTRGSSETEREGG